ncbi:hypothetical protein J6590_063748 [Homalodisca vitripennis]|nr:hypothetical protein J6590_063748 [Homalodisca vitripennis]
MARELTFFRAMPRGPDWMGDRFPTCLCPLVNVIWRAVPQDARFGTESQRVIFDLLLIFVVFAESKWGHATTPDRVEQMASVEKKTGQTGSFSFSKYKVYHKINQFCAMR